MVRLLPRLKASLHSFVQRRTKLQFLLATATLAVGVAATCRAEWGQIPIALLTFLLFRRILALPTVYLSTAGRSVLVTGCDHGFGEGAMRKLQERGFRVFAGCLTQAKVDQYSREFSPDRVVPLLFDVTRPEHAEAARQRVEKEVGPKGGLFGLVNNAGVLTLAPVDWLDMKDFRFNMEVNFFGVLNTTKVFLPLLVRGKGRVVQLGSVAGHLTAPSFASYAASKHALEALTDACRAEFWDLGVTVVRLNPAVMSTNMASDFVRSFERVWSCMPPKKQAAYGDKYKAAAQRDLTDLVSNGENPQQVINTLVEALTISEPKAAYRIGKTAAPYIWISRFQWILDVVFNGTHPLANIEGL